MMSTMKPRQSVSGLNDPSAGPPIEANGKGRASRPALLVRFAYLITREITSVKFGFPISSSS